MPYIVTVLETRSTEYTVEAESEAEAKSLIEHDESAYADNAEAKVLDWNITDIKKE